MRYSKNILLLLLCAVMLCACNEEKKSTTNNETTKIVSVSENSIFTANAASKWKVGKGNFITKADDSLLFSSKLLKPSTAGATQGTYTQVPQDVESKVSGKKIKISVVAKKGSTSSSSFAVAYSTAQVGNSGWHKFFPSSEYDVYSFEYTVPKMKTPNFDYIAIWGDTTGKGNGVSIKEVAIEIVE